MTKRETILKNAEDFVRRVISEDFKQSTDDVNVSAIARRVSRTIPKAGKPTPRVDRSAA